MQLRQSVIWTLARTRGRASQTTPRHYKRIQDAQSTVFNAECGNILHNSATSCRSSGVKRKEEDSFQSRRWLHSPSAIDIHGATEVQTRRHTTGHFKGIRYPLKVPY